jgi:hypothetical protein
MAPDGDDDGDGLNNSVEAVLGTDPNDPDSDNDSAIDGLDSCPLAAEDADAFEDGDGCPESDNDLDGICDPGQSSVSCTGSDTGQMKFYPANHDHGAPTFDCRNVAEDYDSFKDGDGCPEPDNDNDSRADGDDQCDGTDTQAGVDGSLGSGEDLDHDGILDAGEDQDPLDGMLTTDDAEWTFEDVDGILDGDGCYDFPGSDLDGDGFSNEAEVLGIGTRADKACGDDWPSNLVNESFSLNKFDIADLGSYVAPMRRFDRAPGEAEFGSRWDLVPGSTFGKQINVVDVGSTITGVTGYPPMFNGQRAFGRTCPFPP